MIDIDFGITVVLVWPQLSCCQACWTCGYNFLFHGETAVGTMSLRAGNLKLHLEKTIFVSEKSLDFSLQPLSHQLNSRVGRSVWTAWMWLFLSFLSDGCWRGLLLVMSSATTLCLLPALSLSAPRIAWYRRQLQRKRLLYKSAKGIALLLAFLLPQRSSEEEDRLSLK